MRSVPTGSPGRGRSTCASTRAPKRRSTSRRPCGWGSGRRPRSRCPSPAERRGGDGPEGRRRDVAGHAQVAAPAAAGRRATAMARPAIVDRHAERGERALGVIARGRRLDDAGRALGVQAGQQHGALHLRARHLGRVVRWRAARRRGRRAAAGRPSAASMRAPIRVSGAMTRRIGRRESEASPTSVAVETGAPPAMPDSSRMRRARNCRRRAAPTGRASPRRPRPVDRDAVRPGRDGSMRDAERREAGQRRRRSRRRASSLVIVERPSARAASSA